MAQDWFVMRNGKETGPFTAPQLKQMAATGKLQPGDKIRRSDMKTATKASSIKSLFVGNLPATTTTDASAPPSSSPSTRRLGLAVAMGGDALILLCCVALGIIGVLATKKPDATKKERAKADKDKTATKQGGTPKDKEPDEKSTKKDAPGKPSPLDKDIVEWKDERRVRLYTDKLIPILYGVPKSVVKQMPADQLALIDAIEKLGEEANRGMKEEGGNPVLKERLVKNIEKKSVELTDEFVSEAVLKSKMKTPKGWGGRISLGGGGASITIGKVSLINPFDPFYEYDLKQGKKKPPRTIYFADETQS